MKIKLIAFLAGVFAILAGATYAHATVGGPTYIYNLRTNAAANEIMYEVQSLSGKGCPPEVMSINLATGKTTKLVDCDDVNHDATYKTVIAKYPTVLKRAHLPFNQISAKVVVTKEVKENPPQEYMPRTDFSLTLTQQTGAAEPKTLGTFAYSGCSPAQAHIIEGYMMPDNNLRAVIVSSKGDCFEGGYTMEKIFLVKSTALSYTYPLPSRITATPAVVDANNDGNILVVAETKSTPAPTTSPSTSVSPSPTVTTSPTPTTSSNPNLIYQIAIAILAILVIVLGVKASRK